MLIEDLRLPCPHGMWNPHGMTHPRLEGCPGGRVPNRQELIDALGGIPLTPLDPPQEGYRTITHLIPEGDA